MAARRLLWIVVSVALLLGVGVVGPAWADPVPPAEEASSELVRPDWVSAAVTARAQGVRVEVLSERSETMRVFVRPDGVVDEEVAFAPVRFEDATGADGWREIDTALVVDGDVVRPRAMPLMVELGAASEELVVFDRGGAGEVGVVLEGVVLPKPVLEGSVATYPEVLPGVDVTVEVRSAGFEVLWVVKSAEAVQGLVDRFGGAGEVSLPVRLESKASVVAGADGTVALSSAGVTLGGFVAPSMWDSSAVSAGERGAETAVEMVVAGKAGQVPGGLSSRSVELGADEAWLLDESRVFPVVIDPTYAVATGGPVFDTFVQQGFTTDQSGSAELKVGNNGQGQVARSFLNFNASLFKGRQIQSASLSLWESWSWNCSPSAFASYDSGLASTASRWTAQPTIGARRAWVAAAKGYSSACPAGRVGLDMTAQAKAWSSTSASQVGMMLRADTESESWGWKRFHSSEGANKPVLTVSYNRVPNTPGVPTVDGVTTATVADGSAKSFLGIAKPAMRVVLTDADANSVKTQFAYFYTADSVPVVLCETGYVASGGTAGCASSVSIPDNKSTWIRARSFDGQAWSGWGPGKEVRMALLTPHSPTLSCPSGNGSWGSTVKAKETCTITARHTSWSSSPVSVSYRVNGGAWQTKTFPQIAADRAVATVSVGGVAGGHRVEAYVKSPVGKQSSTAVYSFGYGAPSLTAPTTTVTTHGVVAVKASGAPQGAASSVSGAVQWRVKGGPTWADLPASVTTNSSGTTLTGSFDSAQVLDANPQLPRRTSVVFEVRAKFVYGASATYSAGRDVVRVPHAFGAGFPVDDLAGGQVALWTGEFQASASDAELATPGGGLSISRTHSTFAGEQSSASGVFGPGWAASLEGGPLGVSEMELVDNTRIDGTLVLLSSEGDVLPFARSGGTPRTGATIAVGVYEPIGPDAEASGLRLQASSAGSSLNVIARDEEGVETRFKVRVPASQGVDAEFVTDAVSDAVTGETTAYRYDAQGRVTDIIAAQPDGITAGCVPGTASNGCRVLRLAYATTTSGGDFTGRLKTVSAQVNQETKVLASYAYDTSGRLVTATDAVAGLNTTYTWDGSSTRLASMTPPGQARINYAYSGGRISKVTRAAPASAGGGTAQLAAIIYNHAPTGIAGLNLAQFEDYGLPRTANKAVAVFGPDAEITTAPSAGDERWKRADLWLVDAEGYTIHEARYGSGAWQMSANVYDESDNVIKTWDSQATAAIRVGTYSDIDAAATRTTYNETDVLATDGTVLAPARTRVSDVWTPATMIHVAGGEQPELLRRHVATSYAEHAAVAGVSLPVKTTITAERLDGSVVETLSTTFTGYEKLDSSDPKSGWELRLATSITLDMNGNGAPDAADIRRETRYDGRGRIIEQRQPGAGSTSPGTRRSVYWSAGTNPVDASCGGQPLWAGYLCSESPASQPAGTTLPVARYSDYLWHGAAAKNTDASGAVTRTTTTTFDGKARPVTVTTQVTGLATSTAIPARTTTYDNTTGLVTGTSSTAGSTAQTYDSWGRLLTYNTTTGQTSGTTTNTYNKIGDLITITTPKTVTNYTYDGLDAHGHSEYRGLLTKTQTTIGGQSWSATAAYDAQGQLVLEKLPGQITRTHLYDLTGELVSQTYHGPVTDPDTGATTEEAWLSWSLEANAAGQIVREWNPDGAATTGELDGATAVRADLTYRYDPAGRLTTVTDQRLSDQTSCELRTYTFDQRGNRTQQGSATSTGTTCPTTITESLTRAYDTADRPTTGANSQGAYTYDQLGRQLTIPATDIPDPAAGDVTLRYYADDTARSITQANTTLTYTLDATGRRTTQTTTTSGATTGILTNHYTNDSDNPTWITNLQGATTSTTVYSDLITDDLTLAAISDDTGHYAELALTTPRGDIAATITLPNPTSNATGLDHHTRYTEYGQPTTPPPTNTLGTAANGYGWLGAKQRTATTVGILLMGARLYNPTTAHFTSLDPIHGGNQTPYAYPNDPINKQDCSGLCAVLVARIHSAVQELSKRHNDLVVNKYNLPWKGKSGSVESHQAKYRETQRRLDRLYVDFRRSDCSWSHWSRHKRYGRSLKNAKSWITRPTPVPHNVRHYKNGIYRSPYGRTGNRFPRLIPVGGGGGGIPYERM